MKRYWVVIPVCILLLFFGFNVLASELFSWPSGSIDGISDGVGVTLAPARRNLLSDLRLVSLLDVFFERESFTLYPFEFLAIYGWFFSVICGAFVDKTSALFLLFEDSCWCLLFVFYQCIY